jgi:hypothetical protein
MYFGRCHLDYKLLFEETINLLQHLFSFWTVKYLSD